MRLIVVDGHSLFRSGLAHLFNSQPDFEVVGEADSIKETLALVETYRPDVILMDVGLTDGSGLEAITKILRKKPDVYIVFLTSDAAEERIFTAIRLGAKGFLMKDIAAQALLTALRGLQRGELAVSRRILSRYVEELRPLHLPRGGDMNGKEVTLTYREIEVLAELGNGASNSEIARRLSISENTVKIHVHNILHKLELPSRHEAAAYARRHGLTQRLQVQPVNDTVDG
ncbi:MAG TPA: response regulator transcription factor [Anaerolineales bacterium]|nr:response regulator transcription factor [Anaerolineales bacterium]